jgi:DNA-binding response OmpR family regulator
VKRALVVEDDADIAHSLKHNLEREGFVAQIASDGEAGLKAALGNPPDLVILDLNLPGLDGLEICRRLKKDPATAGVPVVMLTARVAEADKISGLDLGADDYVTKPFSVREFLARVRAVMRRYEKEAGDAEQLADGPVAIDLAARRVKVEGREIALTRKEFDLLADLVRNRGRVLTRERLLERVWGYSYPGETRTVDVHVRRLRKKIGSAADERLETVVGVGYRWRGTA